MWIGVHPTLSTASTQLPHKCIGWVYVSEKNEYNTNGAVKNLVLLFGIHISDSSRHTKTPYHPETHFRTLKTHSRTLKTQSRTLKTHSRTLKTHYEIWIWCSRQDSLTNPMFLLNRCTANVYTSHTIAICMYVCMHLCIYAYMHVRSCLCVCVYVCVFACMHLCMYVCMYAFMYVYMHICKYVYVCGA